MKDKTIHLYVDSHERTLILHSLCGAEKRSHTARLCDIQQEAIYFRGCYDSVGYLKKAGIL